MEYKVQIPLAVLRELDLERDNLVYVAPKNELFSMHPLYA